MPAGLTREVGPGHDVGRVAPMRDAIRYAALISIAAALPALAQTAATPGGITRNGTVTLGTGTSTPAVSPTTNVNPTATTQATPSTTAGGSATGSAGGAPSTSGASGGATSGVSGGVSGSRSSTTSSSRPASGGGSSGSAATAPSSSAPAWVLCQPSGSSGMQPFLAGTNLSCAP
jgi:hypothetical protein